MLKMLKILLLMLLMLLMLLLMLKLKTAAETAADIAADATADDDDLRIWITAADAEPAYFMLRDNDRKAGAITFDFKPSSVSREDGDTEIEVTAKLDVGKAPTDLRFSP